MSNEITDQVSNAQPRRVLSLFDSVCIIVGTIIGSGIFKTSPEIAQNSSGFPVLILLWILGGVVALIGALCFAELMTTNRNEVGGDYVYLKKAYGRPIAFMFAWAAFWIIRPGNIAAMAMIFAEYFNQIIPGGDYSQVIYAVAAVGLLSVTNLLGLKQGKGVQNALTVAKVVGILAIVTIAFASPAPSLDLTMAGSQSDDSLWLAMILVMFTYGGWNDIAFVTGEIRDPKKNLFRSLLLGTMVVTLVYVLINVAFVIGLGYETMASSKAVATELTQQALGAETTFGQRSGQLIAALVCVSCLGAINGMILTSPRIYYALGRDVRPLRALAEWSSQRNTPWQSVVLQSLVTIGLLLVCLRYQDAFKVVVVCTAPYFWGFLGLTVLSLIVMRVKSRSQSLPDDEGTYRVPLFPLPPIFFAAVCGGLFYNSITYIQFRGFYTAFFVVTGLMAIGVVLGLILTHKSFHVE